MGAGVVVAVACTEDELTLVEEAGAPLGAAFRQVMGSDDLAESLEGTDAAVVVVGSATGEFVRHAQACHRLRPNVVTLILTDASCYHETRTELATAPFVSLATICVPREERQLVVDFIRRTLEGAPLGTDELLGAARLRLEAPPVSGTLPNASAQWVLSKLPVGLAVVGASGTVHIWNEQMELLSGTTGRRAIGSSLDSAAGETLAAAVAEVWAEADSLPPGACSAAVTSVRGTRVTLSLHRLVDAPAESRYFLLAVKDT